MIAHIKIWDTDPMSPRLLPLQHALQRERQDMIVRIVTTITHHKTLQSTHLTTLVPKTIRAHRQYVKPGLAVMLLLLTEQLLMHLQLLPVRNALFAGM